MLCTACRHTHIHTHTSRTCQHHSIASRVCVCVVCVAGKPALPQSAAVGAHRTSTVSTVQPLVAQSVADPSAAAFPWREYCNVHRVYCTALCTACTVLHSVLFRTGTLQCVTLMHDRQGVLHEHQAPTHTEGTDAAPSACVPGKNAAPCAAATTRMLAGCA